MTNAVDQDKGSIKLYTDAYKIDGSKNKSTISGHDIKKALNKYSAAHSAEGISPDIAEIYVLLCLQGYVFNNILDDKSGEIRPDFAKFLSAVGSAKGKDFEAYKALMESGKEFIQSRPERLLKNAQAWHFLYGADGSFDGLKDLRHFEVTIRYEVGRDKALGIQNLMDADGDGVEGEAIDAFINVRDNYYRTEEFVKRIGSDKVITETKKKAEEEAKKVNETEAKKIVQTDGVGKDTSQEEIRAKFVGDDGLVNEKGREGYFFNWFLMNHTHTDDAEKKLEQPAEVKKDENKQVGDGKPEVLEVKAVPKPDRTPEGYSTLVKIFTIKDDATHAVYYIFKSDKNENEYKVFDKDLKPVDTLAVKKIGNDAYELYAITSVTEKKPEEIVVKDVKKQEEAVTVKEVKEDPVEKSRRLVITGSGIEIVVAEAPKDAKLPKGSTVIHTFTVDGGKTVYQLVKGEDNKYSVINSATGERDPLFGIKAKEGGLVLSKRVLLAEGKKSRKKKQKADMNTYWQSGKNTWTVQLPGWKKAAHGRYEFSLKKGETLLAVFTDGLNEALLPDKNQNLDAQPGNVYYAVKDEQGAIKVYKLMEWQNGRYGVPQLQEGYDTSFLVQVVSTEIKMLECDPNLTGHGNASYYVETVSADK